MKRIFVLISVILTLNGCATTNDLTKAKGKWLAVNEGGFIPSTVVKYKYLSSGEDADKKEALLKKRLSVKAVLIVLILITR